MLKDTLSIRGFSVRIKQLSPRVSDFRRSGAPKNRNVPTTLHQRRSHLVRQEDSVPAFDASGFAFCMPFGILPSSHISILHVTVMRISRLLLAMLVPYILSAQPATVRTMVLDLPTYPYGDADPAPSVMRDARIYPYTIFDGFSSAPVDSSWPVVRMENRWIRLDIAPGLGGKILGAVDRTTGKQFIYTNDAVKFRRIALRGPWTSGGIEFNFGVVGHTPTTAAAVDHVERSGTDGSVTAFVGSMDLPSRTRWTVAITVRPDEAAIETRTLWHNPTPFFRSQYSWSTAAVDAREDLRYFYPGHAMVPHGTDLSNESWPVDAQGRDVSYYRNNNFEGSKSNFIFGDYQPFFGTFAEGTAMGLGHWALYDDMPGRKVWIWSLARDGAIWEQLLTDHRGQYSEPQAGRLFSQVDHDLLWPHSSSGWTERWFPLKNIGGVRAAAPTAIMNITWKDGAPTIAVSALSSWAEDVVIFSGAREVFKERVSLTPLGVWSKTIAWSDPPERLRVQVGERLRFDNSPEATRLSRPIEYRSIPDTTASGLFIKADQLEKERRLPEALAVFRSCLEMDPLYVAALARSSLILSWMDRTHEAISSAWRALQLSKYDADANYAFGVASRQAGNSIDALEAFGWAARSPAYQTSAYTHMAELYLIQRDPILAASYARRALRSGQDVLRAYHVLALAQRLAGDRASARTTIQQALALDPLDHHASFELALLEGNTEAIRRVLKGITNEFAEQSVLEVALWYHTVGRTSDGLALLQNARLGVMGRFWMAYVQRISNPPASRDALLAAIAEPIDGVTPFREEEIGLFRWACQEAPDAWKTKYYLGLALWAKGRTPEAFDVFRPLSPVDAPTFYLARAWLRRTLVSKGENVDLATAVEQGPTLWRTWHAMNVYLVQNVKHVGIDSALQAARLAFARFPEHTVIRMDLATALFASGRYEECLHSLDSTEVLPYEGSWEAHDLYRRAHLMASVEAFSTGAWNLALDHATRSTKYPEHLGSGEPWEPDHRSASFVIAACLDRIGKGHEAAAKRREIDAYTKRHGTSWGNDHLIGFWQTRQASPPDAMGKDRPSAIPASLAGWLETGALLTLDQARALSPALRVQYEILTRVKP